MISKKFPDNRPKMHNTVGSLRRWEAQHFRIGKRPVVTFFAGPGEIAAMAREMDGSTLKRKMARSAAPFAVKFLGSWSEVGIGLQHLDALTERVRQFAAMHSIHTSRWMVMWPGGNRRHRSYLLGFDDQLSPVTFCKVSLDPGRDLDLFEREASMLRLVQTSSAVSWGAPKLIAFERFDDLLLLMTEAMPAGRRTMTWPRVNRMLSSVLTDPGGVRIGRLGPVGESLAVSPSLRRLVRLEVGPTEVAQFSNGDVRPSNWAMVGGRSWLIDWEFGSDNCPPEVDRVSARINQLEGRTRRSEKLLERLLADDALRTTSVSRIAYCVVHLAERGSTVADRLLNLEWPEARKGAEDHNESVARITRMRYRDRFATNRYAEEYDQVQYGPHTWSSLLWELEREHLNNVLADPAFVPGRAKFLDFACGSGRIIELVSPFFGSATGVDISPPMLTRAKRRVPNARFQRIDLTSHETSLDEQFDLVTLFRFLVNVDHSERLRVMRWIREHMAGPDSRLIFNNHANLWSHKALPHAIRRLNGRRSGLTGNVLSRRSVVQLARESGFELESIQGFGFIGGSALKVMSYDLLLRLQRVCNQIDAANKYAEDQIFVVKPI